MYSTTLFTPLEHRGYHPKITAEFGKLRLIFVNIYWGPICNGISICKLHLSRMLIDTCVFLALKYCT